MTIAMGFFGNYPFAIAAGLGLNAIVAFQSDGHGPVPGRRDGRRSLLEGVVITRRWSSSASARRS